MLQRIPRQTELGRNEKLMKLLQRIQKKETEKHYTTRNQSNRDIQIILTGIVPGTT